MPMLVSALQVGDLGRVPSCGSVGVVDSCWRADDDEARRRPRFVILVEVAQDSSQPLRRHYTTATLLSQSGTTVDPQCQNWRWASRWSTGWRSGEPTCQVVSK
jgi:hypothetical protein